MFFVIHVYGITARLRVVTIIDALFVNALFASEYVASDPSIGLFDGKSYAVCFFPLFWSSLSMFGFFFCTCVLFNECDPYV